MNKVSAYGPDGGIMMTIEQAARECATGEHRMSREWRHSGLTCRVREIPEESRAVMEFRTQFNAVGAPSWIATADMNIVTFERLLALEASVYGDPKEENK